MAAYLNADHADESDLGRDSHASARISIRVKPSVKRTIQTAAALSGIDETAFILNAAHERAVEVVGRHERTVLGRADFEALLAVLDNPPPPTEKLKAAMKRHGETVNSK